jgi:plasmid stability protein
MTINLSIKGVPESLAARLRARAERNHRSLQGELMEIIERAAAEGSAEAAAPTRNANGALPRRGAKTIEQIAAEHRVRFPRPIASGPLAVDIVRADRDSR